MAIIVVEPYKRKRMAETFEKRIEQLSLETKEMVETISSHVDAHLIKQESNLVPLTVSHALPNAEPAAEDESKPANHLPVERREMISAVIGAVATLTVVGLLSLLRR